MVCGRNYTKTKHFFIISDYKAHTHTRSEPPRIVFFLYKIAKNCSYNALWEEREVNKRALHGKWVEICKEIQKFATLLDGCLMAFHLRALIFNKNGVIHILAAEYEYFLVFVSCSPITPPKLLRI